MLVCHPSRWSRPGSGKPPEVAWLDIWGWIDTQLAQSLPGVTVTSETDIVPPVSPALIWSASCAHDDFWEASMTLVVLCVPDQAEELLNRVTDVVQGWQTPGPLHSVELMSLRGQRPAASLGGKSVRQFTLQYTLQWP